MRQTICPVLLTLVFANFAMAAPPVHVSPDNFNRAETDVTFKTKVDQGMFGKLVHVREPASIDNQLLVRMNRDTLYTFGVFDLSQPVTIIKPNTGKRFQSMVVLNEDQYVKLVAYDPGEYVLTREKIGTRYVQVAFRTLVDPNDANDVKAVHALQDQIAFRQADAGKFEIPDWDPISQKRVRDGLLMIGSTLTDSKRVFGDIGQVDEVRHLIGTAGGFGGNPESEAIYLNVTPPDNSGDIAYVLTVKDVPVDGFWSISVYNAVGYFEKNAANAYSFNNITAAKNADSSITIHFGGDPSKSNFLPIMKDWNYTVRLYRPRAEIQSGSWKFPEAVAVH